MSAEVVHKIREDKEEVGYETDLDKTQLEINWVNVIALTLIHIAGIYGLYLRRSGISIYTAIFLKATAYISTFGIIIGHHRLWSHRSFKATKALQILLAIAASTTYQLSIYHWVKDHRMHHKYSETNADPHNPSRGFFFSHIGWLFVKKQNDVIQRGKEMDFSDMENNPIVMFQHRYYNYCTAIFFFFLPTFIPWYFWGESLERAFYICVMYKLILILNATWCINSVNHSIGYRTYDKNIRPTNNTFGMVVTLGEGHHNYHHTFPSDYRSAESSLNFGNPSAKLIDLFCWLGLAYDLNATPTTAIDIWVKKYGDQSDVGGKYLDNFLSERAQYYLLQFMYILFHFIYVGCLV